jgi:hypothetical protein
MKDYSGQRMSGKKLAIVKLFASAIISNPDDVADDLGKGVSGEVYNNFFNDKFVTLFRNQSCFDTVCYMESAGNLMLSVKTLEISNKEKINILLPAEKYIIDNDKIIPDFVLFVDSLQISRIASSSGMYANGRFKGGKLGSLVHQLNFALWDNTKGKIVSYGRIEDESFVGISMVKSNWESVLQGLAGKILSNSPFAYSFTDYIKFYRSDEDSL